MFCQMRGGARRPVPRLGKGWFVSKALKEGGHSCPPAAENAGGQERPPSPTWKNREEFKVRVLEWAAKLEVDAKAIYIRPMTRKWASCSTSGTLSFNDELIGMDRELGEYVIVHELLHFSVPNHGKLWKSLMQVYLGDWEKKENLLRSMSHTSS